MIWPSSTPQIVRVPSLNGPDKTDYDNIVDVLSPRPGHLLFVATKCGIHVYQVKPLCIITSYCRNQKSIDCYGENVSLLARSDMQIIGTRTSFGHIISFTLQSISPGSELYQLDFNKAAKEYSLGEHMPPAYPGPGEAVSIPSIQLKFRMPIRIDSEATHALSLGDEILILTKSPQAIKILSWTPDARGAPRTKAWLLSDLDWLSAQSNKSDPVNFFVWSKAMGLSAWATELGKCWLVVRREDKNDLFTQSSEVPLSPLSSSKNNSKQLPFRGFCFHDSSKLTEGGLAIKIAINARYSLFSVGSTSGLVYLYNIKDYTGNVLLVRTIKPSLNTGGVTMLSWSPDGTGLLVGYERGWAFYSVYGYLSSTSSHDFKESKLQDKWLQGLTAASWLPSGDGVMLVPKDSKKFYLLDVLRWNVSTNFHPDNIRRPILFKNNKLLVYRGHEQSDLVTISHESLSWQIISVPASYIAENWPVKAVASSNDGNYIAVAGIRGLTHFSLYSGRWKMFVDDQMDREFTIKANMIWYGSILIAAVETEKTHEIRMYSRDLDLDTNNTLYFQEFPASILYMSLIHDSLLVYTVSNILYHFRIKSSSKSVDLVFQSEISFSDLIYSPARVRSIHCLPKPHDEIRSFMLDESNVLFLVDGMLVLLRPVIGEDDPNQQIQYSRHILHDHIEYFSVSSHKNFKNCIWAFDGKDMLIYFNDGSNYSPKPCRLNLEVYPLTTLIDKGIIMGVDTELIQNRSSGIRYFEYETSTSLIIHYILEYYLREDKFDEALALANDYKRLKYFNHSLEILLFRIVESEQENNLLPESSLIIRAVKLIELFPQYLDIIAGCARKIEVSYWRLLFSCIGEPKLLFQRCIDTGKLKTAGKYLLILNTLDQLDSSMEDTILLFSKAVESGDWDLCKELSRFLIAIDSEGSILKEVLGHPSVNMNFKK
ncbi:RIC1-domain-containing protein [Nadsonia fulvescens var. elongata DSM 6958]|uniref:RIC1-domain-containing protein n=1 Tax=Nadsonia fulvescens var. elongata DSM 6958 TaxID=857566 RepID=A0A1E3PQZ8_9ASCO|nr:RIC1-domain-containing protein [Nadsonia fulvescens var. elongata DSM 6958]